MSPDACRAARAGLGWSVQRLAARSGLALRTVEDFEAGRRQPRSITLIALRRAFREAGVRVLDAEIA